MFDSCNRLIIDGLSFPIIVNSMFNSFIDSTNRGMFLFGLVPICNILTGFESLIFDAN